MYKYLNKTWLLCQIRIFVFVSPPIASPAQGHAGVFGCLPAGEHLVITQPGQLAAHVQDLQSADLQAEETMLKVSDRKK